MVPDSSCPARQVYRLPLIEALRYERNSHGFALLVNAQLAVSDKQQGGDMVRVGGLNYTCDPTAPKV